MNSKLFSSTNMTVKRVLSLVLAFVVTVTMTVGSQTRDAEAATTITSMAYYSANDGPVISHSGVSEASYGFVMPIFNGGAATWTDVVDDLKVNVKVNGVWTDIDSVGTFIYNSNWGHWSDGGFNGYWFTVSETTEIQLYSVANPGVTLEYTLEFIKLDTTTITSMAYYSANDGPTLKPGPVGSVGFCYPIFNGNSAITYEQVADDLKVYVKTANDSDWVDIDNNAASGWIYDSNFGQFWDGPGGYWFTVSQTTEVRLQSVSSGIYLDYTIVYEKPTRNSYTITASGATTLTADESGALGLSLPYIDGGFPYQDELDLFVYEILIDGAWVELANAAASGFSYQGNGYNKMSAWNQWGYWADYCYGLWFQPIQEDMQVRVGYPLNGVKGGDIGNNYVVYNFIGNPDAPRPDPAEFVDIELGTVGNTSLDGWNLIWNDEFDGNALDMSKWSYQTGYYLNSDPGTWGWGNSELEYYTDSTENTFVSDGKVHFRALDDPKTFPEIDPNRVAPYSSGKIITQNKFSFKYGRIDFCAKLPTGNGIWPALWMMPEDSVYGGWAASGEIDVMEARGRIPNSVCGTIHFGSGWPDNKHLGGDYIFPDGSTFDDGYHVYSCIWEANKIKWYVDGHCFSVINNDQWYSSTAPNNPLAPFDQEFYIIMNLAVGGMFDGGITPNAGDIPAQMDVEYVRVYQAEGDTSGSYSDNTSGTVTPSAPSTEPTESETQTQAPTESETQTQAPSESESEAPSSSSSESTVIPGDGDYVYDAAAGTVNFTFNDSATQSIIYLATYGSESEARDAYNTAMSALPGIDLPGHAGMFMTTADGVHTYSAAMAEGTWFVYGFNALGTTGLQTWKIGVAQGGSVEESTEAPTEAPTQAPTETESEAPSESSSESTVIPSSDGYVYDAASGNVTFTLNDSAAESIIYLATYGSESEARDAYNTAMAALPGIDLPGHAGMFMTTADGVHTYTTPMAEGTWFVYGFNALGTSGFQTWKIGVAQGEAVEESTEAPTETPTEAPTETPTEPSVESSEEASEDSSEALVKPSKVTGVEAVYENGKIKVTWDDNGAAQYRVMRFTSETGYTTMTYKATSDGYVDTDLIEAQLYYYRICGYFYDANGNLVQGSVSDSVAVVATDKAPAKVTNLSASVNNGTVTLTWDAAEGVRYYKIARAYGWTTADGSYSCLKYNVSETTYADTPSYKGKWRYKVVGYYKDTDGSWVYGDMSSTLFLTVE